jgi:hypothetical protein
VRERLAEQLLAAVMDWEEDDVSRERPVLQAFADYKYDGYEQFGPGRRFIESLAGWLNQLPQEQRADAYNFVRDHLIFVSRAEMQYLVDAVYPDVVRRRLITRAAIDLGVARRRVTHVAGSKAFARRRRSCLFLGLSDGAHTDVLRRANPRDISNEQVIADHSSLEPKAKEAVAPLRKDLKGLEVPNVDDARFTTVVLLDDFSASGVSYIRNDGTEGKIAKIAKRISALPEVVDLDDLEVIIVLYVATTRALSAVRAGVEKLVQHTPGSWTVRAIQELGPEIVFARGTPPELAQAIRDCYDEAINDEHMKKGGADGRWGFADCGLPLVLAHNTPNNSIALLWADTDEVRGLFPRVTRHRGQP